jgi:copper(I)-binding protein
MRLALGIAYIALAGCNAPAPDGVAVEGATINLPAVSGRPGAGYFTVTAGKKPARLVSVTSPRIQRIELHDSGMVGAVMRMGPLRDTNIPAGGTLKLEPGGKHAMLFGIDPVVKPGDHIPLTFTFEPAPPVTVEADVLGPGESSAER